MSGRTPGKWITDGAYTVMAEDSDQFNGNYAICVTEGPDKIGNARLIAAAPELLNMLERVVDNEEQRVLEDWLSRERPSGDVDSVQSQWLSSYDYSEFCTDWQGPLDAIDKARGIR